MSRSYSFFCSSLAVSAVLLSACSGSTGITANAGPDQTAIRGALVTLDGTKSSSSRGGPLAYRWLQRSGPVVDLRMNAEGTAQFFAPTRPGKVVISLVVDDGQGVSTPDDVTITLENHPPVANAGPDGYVRVGRELIVDGVDSSDPNGDLLNYIWTQIDGPQVQLEFPTASKVRFLAPSEPTTLQFSLRVSDTELDSEPDVVVVRVLSVDENAPPMSGAGPDQQVGRNKPVKLEGVGYDEESGTLAYRWTQLSGPPVVLAAPSSSSTQFTSPEVDGPLVFELTVSDGQYATTDTVTIVVKNHAPVFESTSLTPMRPGTLEDLSAAATITDGDGDAVTVQYQWLRNGAPIPGQTGPVLPHSETTRGDEITANVTATDGYEAVTSSATTTIVDTPPTVSVSGAPASVGPCGSVSFTVSASDIDGDLPGPFRLVHGPAGMTVSPNGQVNWSACLPMFDRSLEVRWSIGLVDHPEALLTGTVRVEDPSRASTLRRTSIEIPVLRSGLQIADLDGDGMVEMLVGSEEVLYSLAKSGNGYAQQWVYPFGPPDGGAFLSVVARDLEGDGHQEIIFSSRGNVVLLDGVTRREVARFQTGSANGCRNLEIADLDRDGTSELICLEGPADSGPPSVNQRVRVFDPKTLKQKWETPPRLLGLSLAVGNVDGDPALEIVTANGVVFDGASQQAEWTWSAGFGASVDTGDLDGDGIEEIVGAADWYRFRGFSALTRTQVWEVPVPSDLDTVLVADFEGDSKAEVLIGDRQGGEVTAYRYDPVTNTLPKIFEFRSPSSGVSSLSVGDVDGDGAKEFVWGSGRWSSGEDSFVIAGRNPTIGIEWTNANPNELDGPFFGGRPARLVAGSTELLFGVGETNSGYDGARLVRLDPGTGAVVPTSEIASNWSGGIPFSVADYDGDGIDEALIGTADLYDGFLTAFDVAGNLAKWTSPKKLGTVLAVVSGDANADGYPDLISLIDDRSTHQASVSIYDVKNNSLVWKSAQLGSSGRDLAFADLDGDGFGEIVVLSDGWLRVFARASSGTATYVERSVVPQANSVLDLVVDDLDGDATPEVYVLSSTSTGSVVTRYSSVLRELTHFAPEERVASIHSEGLGTGRRNLLLGIGDASPFSSPSTAAPSRLAAVDAVTGAEVWSSPVLGGTVARHSVTYVDLSGSSVPEIAFGTTSGMHVTR